MLASFFIIITSYIDIVKLRGVVVIMISLKLLDY